MGAGLLVIAAGAFVLINRRHPRFLAGIKPTQLALCYFANPSRDLQRPEKDIGHLAAAAAGDDRRASRGKIAEGLYVFQTKGLDKYQVGGGRALRRIQSRRDKNKDEALALIRSDLGEALEALRTGGMDDELPHRKGIEVKLAGVLIRIFEYAGAYQLDLDGAVRERLAYKEAA